MNKAQPLTNPDRAEAKSLADADPSNRDFNVTPGINVDSQQWLACSPSLIPCAWMPGH